MKYHPYKHEQHLIWPGLHTFIVAGFMIILFAACIGPKKADKWIATKYGENVSLNKPRADYYTLSSPLITSDEKASTTVKNGTKTLPLLIYWRFDYSITSTLNPKILINQFTSAFTTYANSKQLKQKLNGRSLDLVVEQLPASFTFHDDLQDINLFIAQIHWEKIYLLPQTTNMIVRYTISGQEKKTGIITLSDNNQVQKKKLFQRMSSAYDEYLAGYDENIKVMAKSTVDKLLVELMQ